MRTAENGPLKYASRHYGFPVMTAQEQDLLLNEVTGIAGEAKGMVLVAQYSEKPNGVIGEFLSADGTVGEAPQMMLPIGC